ncbi:MAG TPA: glutamate synthase [Isosphaeraceae bacterium]|nr:glutamate synthase [Isosphaeraceae bacterium]
MESDHASRAAAAPSIVVPELRDYQQINAELVRRLNLGDRHVRLEGVAGQRLLVSRIAGAWQALIEVDGNAGPELAAELNAPGLTVVCRGSAADGAGRGLAAGRLLIGGEAGAAIGYFQRGGLIVAVGDVGPRAGLAQCGGDLVLLGKVGALAGERQAGGRLVFKQGRTGPHAGHGRRAGRLIALPSEQLLAADLDQDDDRLIEAALGLANRFFSPA